MKKIIGVSVTGIVIVGVAFIFLSSGGQKNEQPTSHEQNARPLETAVMQDVEKVVVPDLSEVRRLREEQALSNIDQYVQEMIERIKAEFGARIEQISVQVGLKDFRDDLMLSFPGKGMEIFERIIRGAFPELADTIFASIAKMDQYDEWLLAMMPDLNDMDLMAQQNTLWEKRLAMFGEDAKTIWQVELSPEEERNESVRKTVAMLNTADELPMDERLYLLQAAFDENYSQTMSELVVDTTSVMTQVFFRFDSVQRDLEQMGQAERIEKISDVRRQLGFSEEKIEFMAEQDQQKEVRWQNGYEYMEERKSLEAADLPEQEFESRLADLRVRYFGDEAYTIGKEEDELGFFRYERPRIYGWN